MSFKKSVFFIFLFFLFANIGFVYSQSTDTAPPQIVNLDEENIIRYCSDSVAVAPNISIQSIKIDSYLWEFGDGNKSGSKDPSNIYVNTGTSDLEYDVKLTVISREGCENAGVLKDTVIVHPIPSIDLSFQESTCHSESMEIWHKGSGGENDTYCWDLSEFRSGEIITDPGISQGPLKIKSSSEPTV